MNCAYLKRVLIKRGLPLQLIFFVTDDCNCRCRHCNVMAKPREQKPLLRLDEIEKAAGSLKGLMSLSLTGGEPFLRPDLQEIAGIFYKAGSVSTLVIITNGTLTDKILGFTDNIMRLYPKLNFFIGVSVDAPERLHDDLRSLPGCFAKARETIRQLKEIKKHCPRLSIGTATTCSVANQDGLIDTYELIVSSLQPDASGINLQRPADWTKRVEGLDMEQYRKFVTLRNDDIKSGKFRGHPDRFLNRLFIAKEKIQYSLIDKVYSGRSYCVPCFAGNLLGILKEDGGVFACEMRADAMGNIRDFGGDFSKAWNSKQADAVREEIRRQRCFCTYECAMTTSILFNAKFYPRLLKEMLFK